MYLASTYLGYFPILMIRYFLLGCLLSDFVRVNLQNVGGQLPVIRFVRPIEDDVDQVEPGKQSRVQVDVL